MSDTTTGAISSVSGNATSATGMQTAQGNAQNTTGTEAINQGIEQSKDQSIKQQLKKLGDADMNSLVTLTVNGKTIEKPLREAIKISQLEEASYEKMKQAAQREKSLSQKEAQIQQLFDLAKKDFGKFSEIIGLDADQVAEARLARKYELMQMSPEQRELQELKQWRAQQEQIQKQQKEQFEKEQMTVAEKQESQKLEQEIIKAWDDTKLPKNKYFGALMAFQMLNHQKINGQPLPASEAAAKVKAGFVNDVKSIIGDMDASAILELLGKDVMAKIRKYDVEQVTGKPAFTTQKSPSNTLASQSPKKTLNEIEWRKAMGLS